MKEHLLAIVFLGLLFLMFQSPFPNRLLDTETVEQKKEIPFLQENEFEYLPFEIEEMTKDSISLSPGAAAFLERY